MTKCLLIILVAGLLINLNVHSQISLYQSDMPEAGEYFIYANDESPYMDTSLFGVAGENQIWDLSWIGNQYLDTTWYFEPSQTPYQSDFPAANLASTENQGEYSYLFIDADKVQIIGVVMPTDMGLFKIPMSQTMMYFPYTYLSENTDTVVIDQTIYYGQEISGYQVDSIRYKSTVITHTVVDGWGTVTTPHYTDNVLRVKSHSNQIDSLWGLIVITFPMDYSYWYFYQEAIDSSDTYKWYPQNRGSELASVEVKHDTIIQSSFLVDTVLLSKPKIYAGNSVSVYPNPAIDRVFVNSNDIEFIEFYNSAGVFVSRKNINEKQVDIKSLTQGFYTYRLYDKSGFIAAGKLQVR